MCSSVSEVCELGLSKGRAIPDLSKALFVRSKMFLLDDKLKEFTQILRNSALNGGVLGLISMVRCGSFSCCLTEMKSLPAVPRGLGLGRAQEQHRLSEALLTCLLCLYSLYSHFWLPVSLTCLI